MTVWATVSHRITRPWTVLLATSAVFAAQLAAAPTEPSHAARQTRPNIVMIMTDDQEVASLQVMPNVRRLLARQGTTFSRSIVSYPLCCPSRATYLTGQYPHNHQVVGNGEPDGGYYRLRGSETLPVWLSRAGYATAHIGKYLNGYGRRDPVEIPPGWQEWYGSVDPTTYRMWGYTLNENGALKTYGRQNVQNPALYQTDVYARKAVDYINRRAPADQPFFLSVATLAPHSEGTATGTELGNPRPAPRHRGTFADRPLPRPPSFNEVNVSDKPAHIRRMPRLTKERIGQMTRNHRARLESLLAVDEAVARVVDALRMKGELANTLILFTSDNGWLQGEHRIPSGKVHPYTESSGVPLIVSGPGMPRGRQRTTPVANIDLAPTILDAARARPGIVVDGRSLLRLAHNPVTRDLLIETGPKPSGQRWYAAVRTPRHLYIEHSTGEQELYDLRDDPFQLASLHTDPGHAALRRDLARRLHRLQRCLGASCRS